MSKLILRDKVKSPYLEPDDIVAVDKRGKAISNPLLPFAYSLEYTVILDYRIRGKKKVTKQDYYYSPGPLAPTSIAQRLKDVQPIDIKRYLEFLPIKPFTPRRTLLTERRVFGATVHYVPAAVKKVSRIINASFPTVRTESFPSVLKISERLTTVEKSEEQSSGICPAWRADAKSWPGRFNRALDATSDSMWTQTIRASAKDFIYYALREQEAWTNDDPIDVGRRSVMIAGRQYWECGCGNPYCTEGGLA